MIKSHHLIQINKIMKPNIPFTASEVPEDFGDDQSVQQVLQGMILKGLLKIVGANDKGEVLYQVSDVGKVVYQHLDSDNSIRN